jgi:dephospho-CoA kinase
MDDMSNTSTPCKPLIVGLTGGIGSGKSTATACFERLGIPVIDADMVAREVVLPGSAALRQIASHFGDSILLGSGELDRARLRQQVFAEPRERLWLEGLLHPRIQEGVEAGLARAVSQPGVPYVILSSPLLLETGQHKLVDRVLLIGIDPDLQRERLLRRDRVTIQTAEAIIAAQWNQEQRSAHAQDVILNNGSINDLQTAVRAMDARYRHRPPPVTDHSP